MKLDNRVETWIHDVTTGARLHCRILWRETSAMTTIQSNKELWMCLRFSLGLDKFRWWALCNFTHATEQVHVDPWICWNITVSNDFRWTRFHRLRPQNELLRPRIGLLRSQICPEKSLTSVPVGVTVIYQIQKHFTYKFKIPLSTRRKTWKMYVDLPQHTVKRFSGSECP